MTLNLLLQMIHHTKKPVNKLYYSAYFVIFTATKQIVTTSLKNKLPNKLSTWMKV